MKIREVTQKAENLIEQGKIAKNRQIQSQQAVNSARSRVVAAYERLAEAESETDEDGYPIGDVAGARSEVYAAQALLEAAEEQLEEANRQLEIIGNKKMDTVREIERYEAVEEGNMSKLQELQNKRFGANANAFMADLAARMNSGEQARQNLLNSLGMASSGKSYSAGTASGGGASSGSTGSGGGSGISSQNISGTPYGFAANDNHLSFTRRQLEQYRALRKELELAQLVMASQQVTQAQALGMLMQESDAQCSGKARTPSEILQDMNTDTRENWMNNFNAERSKKALSKKLYEERLALYRTGLAYYLGKERADRLTENELEELANKRSAYPGGPENFDTVKYVRENFIDVISNGDYKENKNPNEYNPKNPSKLEAILTGKSPEKRRISFEDDYQSARKWCREKLNNKFTDSEFNQLVDYSGTLAESLNKALYTPGTELTPNQLESVREIDSAISKNILKDDVVVYRAVDKKAMQSYLNGQPLCKGNSLHFDAYSSTTLCTNSQYIQAHPYLDYIMKFTVKAGTPTAALEELTLNQNEDELLFGRQKDAFITNVFKGKRRDLSSSINTLPEKDIVIIEAILY